MTTTLGHKSRLNNIWIALDFETSDPNKYACKIDRVCAAKFNIKTGKVLNRIDHNLRRDSNVRLCGEDLQCPVVVHNASFELHLMERRLSIPIKGELHDTYLMAKHFRNDLPAYDLKSLSWYFLGDLYTPLTRLREWIHKHNMKGEDDIEFDMTKCPDNLVHDYCMHDVKMTAKIASLLYKEVRDNYAYQQDAEMLRVNAGVEASGITVDVPYLKKFGSLGRRRVRRNLDQAAERLRVEDGKKPTGHALRRHLSDLGEGRRTPTGMTRADDVVLRDHALSSPVRAVQRVRRDQKLVNTYARNILAVVNEKGVFHPNLAQSAAITRRYRSWNMYGDNGMIVKGQVQNVPRGSGIRTGFIVPPGFAFVKLDLASIEARLGSHAMSVFLGEDWFAKQYREKEGFNIYLHVVEECTGHKGITKKDNIYEAYKHGTLGVQYGVGINQFYRTLHDKFHLPYTVSKCDAIYQSIRRKFPVFHALQRAVSSLVETKGRLYDDFGAVYYLPPSERYKGVNYYCQGCAGNVFKWWVLRMDKLMRGTQDYMFNFVHDEVDVAVKRELGARGRVRMYCDVLKELDIFEVPIVAESSGLCDNWEEAG